MRLLAKWFVLIDFQGKFPLKMQLFIIVYEKRNELEFHYFLTNINVTHQLFKLFVRVVEFPLTE